MMLLHREGKYMVKPPIGVSPSWYVIPNRNKELADAISRFSTFDIENLATRNTKEDLKAIIKWATEIKMNCEILLEINEY
jgi:hypothetical protein